MPSKARGGLSRRTVDDHVDGSRSLGGSSNSFPSWTSPVRRRSPALDETLGNTEGFFRVGGSEPSLLTEGVPGGFRVALELGDHLVEALSVHARVAVVLLVDPVWSGVGGSHGAVHQDR